MSFVSYSALLNGPLTPEFMNDEDTYIAVFSHSYMSEGQQRALKAIKTHAKILYTGPVTYNHYHFDRRDPCQYMIIFEKPCQQQQSPAPDVSPVEKTLEETI